MDITIPDIVQLERQAGEAENDQRLRAILAERRIRELEAQIVALQAMPAKEEPS